MEYEIGKYKNGENIKVNVKNNKITPVKFTNLKDQKMRTLLSRQTKKYDYLIQERNGSFLVQVTRHVAEHVPSGMREQLLGDPIILETVATEEEAFNLLGISAEARLTYL